MTGIIVKPTARDLAQAESNIKQYNDLLQKEIRQQDNMDVKKVTMYALTIVRQYMIKQIGKLYTDEFMINQMKDREHEKVGDSFVESYQNTWNGK